MPEIRPRPGLPPSVFRPALVPMARWIFSAKVPWSTSRKRLELASLPLIPPSTKRSVVTLGGVPGEELVPKGADPSIVVLYLHGGGYTVGSSRTHRPLVAGLAGAVGGRAITLDYRLAPEHPFPAAVDDAEAAYRALLDDGVDPARVIVAGDSAGGGMTLALALRLKASDSPLPGALGLICPWVDITRAATDQRSAPLEPLLSRSVLHRFARDYLAGGDERSLDASPLFGELAGLPPTVIQSGAEDLLAGDAVAVETKLRSAGVTVDHRAFDGLWHDFQLHSPPLGGEASIAVRELGAKLRSVLSV